MQSFMFYVSFKIKYKCINNRRNGVPFSSFCLRFAQLSSTCLSSWHILEYTLPCLFNCMIQPFLDILTANHCKLDQTFERNAVMCWKADGTGPTFSREVKHTSIPAWVHSKLWVLVLNCWCKKISAVAWNNRIILSSYSHYLLKKSDIWTC